MKRDPPNPTIQRTPSSTADFDCYSLPIRNPQFGQSSPAEQYVGVRGD